MPLFILFACMTLIEVYVMIAVGSVIGPLATILLIILTALIGSILFRKQGWITIYKIQTALARNESVNLELLEGFVILISAIVLLTPGFITDIIGLLGLIPTSRKYFINIFLQKNARKFFRNKGYFFTHTRYKSSTKENKKDDKYTIDGEFWED